MMEQSPGNDEMNAAALVGLGDGIPRGRYRLEKYRGDIEAGTMELEPYEVLEFENAYVNVGGAELLDIIGGAGSPVKFDNGHAYLGVGDSATATGASMTDLQASSNKTYKAMDATFPSRSGQVMTWRATFGSSDANYHWLEGALFNGNNPPTAKMLSRIAQDMGTKASGTSWVLTYTITCP